jgi:hypothetical protein
LLLQLSRRHERGDKKTQMKPIKNLFLSLFIMLMAMFATPAFAQTTAKIAPTATTTIALPVPVGPSTTTNDDASRYAERESMAKQQADFKGGDSVTIGITATATAVLLIILLIILL